MIQPMLCKPVKALLHDDNYIYEQKMDGGRMLAYIQQGRVKILTRQGNIVSNKFPEIIAGLMKLPSCVLDGEIVVFNDGKTDFKLYQRRVMMENPFQIKLLSKSIPATFIVFDIVELDGNDLRYYTLMERKKILHSIVKENGCIKPIIYYENPHFLLKKQHLIEGIVAKRKDSVYEAGKRSGAWIKYRFVKEDVVDAVEYEITPSGVVAIDEQGHRITVNGKQAEAVRQAIDEDGKVKLEINYMEKTDAGRYRFPAFRRVVV